MKKKLLCLLIAFTLLLPVISVSANNCNHQWGEWDIIDATCGDVGYKFRYCEICWKEEEIKIPATGNHHWGEWFLFEEPECFKGGKNIRYCEVCGEEQFISTSAYNSHNWTAWKTDEKPTCGISGSAYRYCTRCSREQFKTLPIDPNNHQLASDAWYEWDEPTALHGGRDRRECDCGERFEYRKTKKLKAKVKLKKTKLTLKRKKSYTLKIKSRTYGDKISKWKTSNKKIATVSKKGKIRAKKKGKVKITLYMKSGAKASCTLKVK